MNDTVRDELLKLEEEWTRAIITNDASAIKRFLADDWFIIGPEGKVVERSLFLDVIESGSLIHDSMESDDVLLHIYGDSAVMTAQTKSIGKFQGQPFSTNERATSVFAKIGGRWQCVLTQLTSIAKA